MENYSFLIYVGCIVAIVVMGRFFVLPIKKIAKLVINSILGAAIIYITNLIGANFGYHIGLNWYTILCSGLLGVPGVVLLFLLYLI